MSNASTYKAYASDSEDSSGDESDSSYTSTESLLNTPGKNSQNAKQAIGQVFSAPIKPPLQPPRSTLSQLKDFRDPLAKFETKETTNTSLFMINSRNRDTNVYAQPTFFTLRLPRVYKNVTRLNISQINLLNSFFNFTFAAGNTYMDVYEEGRILPNTLYNSVQVRIRDGTYNATDLVTELNSAMNATPLFASITFSQFLSTFQASGDFSPMFNTPGAIVYNSLDQSYSTNVSMSDIVARYFQVSQTVGTLTFTYNQSLVAYYYPVIKELMLDPATSPDTMPFNVEGYTVPSGFRSWYDYIVFGFTGLDDPYISAFLTDPANIAIFDNYRNQKTFNTFLVNAYTCTYNPKQGRLIISAPSLAQSITTDLNTQYNNILATVVGSNPNFSSVDDFQNQYNNIVNSNGYIIEFYNYIQSRFASNFAVGFGSYAPQFYGNSNNLITLYNPTDHYGWSYTFAPGVSQSTITTTLNPPAQIDNYWSNIHFPKSTAPEFLSTLVVPQFQGGELFFSNSSENSYGFTDISFSILPTSYIRTAFTSRCRQSINVMTFPRYANERGPGTDEVYNLSSNGTPLLYKFVSFTLPGPVTITSEYILTDVSGNTLFDMYTVNQSMLYSEAYMREDDRWTQFMISQIINGSRLQPTDPANFNKSPPKNDIGLTSYRPFMFFQLNADKYYYEANAHFYIRFFVETQDGTTFPVPIVISWYKDRAGFMADIQSVLNGANYNVENPRHYFKTQTFDTTVSSAYLDVDVNNNQQTYMYVHMESASNIANGIPLRVFAVLRDTYGEYTIATQLDKLDMPYAIVGSISDQFTPNNAQFKEPVASIYDTNIFQLGYDSNVVSNNLLDYVIQAQNNVYYDPNNISNYINGTTSGLQYQFNLNTPASSRPNPAISSPTTWSLYFGSNATNIVRDTYNNVNNVYLSSLQAFQIQTTYNEASITNWFNPNSLIKETYLTPYGGLLSKIDINSIFLPCINTLSPLITDMSTTSLFQDFTGTSGLSFFLPPNSAVKLDSFVIKFVYTQPTKDSSQTINYNRSTTSVNTPNTSQYYNNRTTFTNSTLSTDNDWDDWFLYNRRNTKLGIFKTSDISGARTDSLFLNNALCTMTLEKITQVNNLQNVPGSLYTREPEWGTWYKYSFDTQSKQLWDVSSVDPSVAEWNTVTTSQPDFGPTFVNGNTSYPNFFLTFPTINNYTFLPKSYGIAPSVGNAVNYPYTNVSSYVSDIPNSYTAVPFYYDQDSTAWRVGSFYGLSFTREPALPSTSLVGSAPFYGPPGIFAWNSVLNPVLGYNTIQLYKGEQATFQPYYWNMKINFEDLYTQYDPATDLTAFGGVSTIAQEYQDTMLFMYSNSTIGGDLRDISTTQTEWIFGNEKNTNYSAVDDQSGYNFLSYVYNFTVRRTEPEYAIHVRAYDPIPSFNTGLRFVGKNFTDFGTLSLVELQQEIRDLSGYQPISDVSGAAFINDPVGFNALINANNAIRLSTGQFYSHNYADALVNFDRSFVTSTITFGAKIGFSGVTLSNGFTGFSNAYTQYLNDYSTITNIYGEFTSILSTTNGQLNQYIVNRYGTVLPANALNRNRFTDPIPFQLLLSTTLVSPYTTYYDEWGLGYYLGFNKADRPSQPRTTVTSDTFIRIVQDYIYLRINPEQNANTMAVSAKENLAETRESQGEDNRYFSKIILNDFGSYSRTAIVLPKDFNPVLGRMEVLTCQLVNKNGTQISNVDCDYDMVVEITELSNGPVTNASLSGPTTNLDVYNGNAGIIQIKK